MYALVDWKLPVLYPFQSTRRLTSYRNEWSFFVYMIRLRALEQNSRSAAPIGVSWRRCESRWDDISWWYQGNECRATRGNRSELASVQNSPLHHVSIPRETLTSSVLWITGHTWRSLSVSPSAILFLFWRLQELDLVMWSCLWVPWSAVLRSHCTMGGNWLSSFWPAFHFWSSPILSRRRWWSAVQLPVRMLTWPFSLARWVKFYPRLF